MSRRPGKREVRNKHGVRTSFRGLSKASAWRIPTKTKLNGLKANLRLHGRISRQQLADIIGKEKLIKAISKGSFRIGNQLFFFKGVQGPKDLQNFEIFQVKRVLLSKRKKK